MNTKDAIEQFGSIKELAKALGITQPAIYQWGDKVPVLLDGGVEICHYFLDVDELAAHLRKMGVIE